MKKPLVVILLGSGADREHGQQIAAACQEYGLATEIRVGSAHKTPGHVLRLLGEYEADPRLKVYITVAGRSNALSGFTDGAVSAPVIACPPAAEAFGGADILSSLHMPSGIATALVLEPGNAALLAAKILGLGDARVRQAVATAQARAGERVMQADASLH